MNIVLTEPLGISAEKLAALSDSLTGLGHSFVSYNEPAADEAELLLRVKDADILIIANHPLPAGVIREASRLKFISVAFVGIDHVGLDECTARSIQISNTGGYCTDAVAELSVSLALACLRNLCACDRSVQSCGGKAGLQGNELRGKTVGIIGTGAIGCQTAALFRAFGCRLIGWSRTQRQEALDLGLTYLPLERVMAEADIVSIHTPLTPDTRGLIGEAQIAAMKPGAVLINTARGPVVDTEALAAALSDNRIKAGIDVYESDPPLPHSHPLLGVPNLICTPHIGFDTAESIERRADMAFENVLRWLEGHPVRIML